MSKQSKNEADEFFVGYLSTPKGLSRFNLSIGILLIVLAAFIGGFIAAKQADPGNGSWDLSEPVELTGKLLMQPYPVLYVASADGQPSEPVFVVAPGKVSAIPLLNKQLLNQQQDGRLQHTQIRGYLIQRGERRMIELTGADDDVRWVAQRDSSNIHIPAIRKLKTAEFTGEILDSKCWLGVMKPGHGKAHKACASLCIRGGMPPMFRDGEQLYLLTDPNGAALGLDLLPYVADPIRVTGTLIQHGQIVELRIDPRTIQRI